MMNGYQALHEGVASLDLSARGKIRVTGEDRARLLHAMSTNHVQDLTPGHGLYTFFLNDKGRILADAFIYNLGETLLLDTEPETKTKLFEHLDKFIIADDVTLDDETESLAAIGLEGPASLGIAAQLDIPVGDNKLAIEQFGDGFTAKVTATGAQGLRIFLPATQKQVFLDRLQSAGVIAATHEEARVVRIEHGLPRYGEEISERYLVQETQVTDAIHFNKGCYLGQEIVERVRSRGQVHRLLTPIHIASTDAPPPGAKLVAESKDVGEISSAVYSPASGAVVGLAYLRTEAANSKPTMSVSGSEPEVEARVA